MKNKMEIEPNFDDYKEWWQSLSGPNRFLLMRKYGIKQVSDKLIKRMYMGEFLIKSIT
jgi:hypothetical protein